MALKMSTGLRNKLLSGTNSVQQIFDGGILRLYTGDQPTSPDAAVAGSLVCTFAAGTFGTTSTAGTMGMAGSAISGTCAQAGTVRYFRFSETGDGGTASTTTARLEGVVGRVTDTGVDLTLVDTVLLNNQVLSVTQATLGFPAS